MVPDYALIGEIMCVEFFIFIVVVVIIIIIIIISSFFFPLFPFPRLFFYIFPLHIYSSPVSILLPISSYHIERFFAYGFEFAKECGAKMVTTFKLCSEQLSAQPHYDYGMRAVKTVITAAGNLKRAEPGNEREKERESHHTSLSYLLQSLLPSFRCG
jgi:hypothetical protein